MAVLRTFVILTSCAVVSAASNLRRRQSGRHGLAGPFDCYAESDKGKEYAGLVGATTSGRKCKEWVDEGTHPNIVGNFCRNPGGSKDKPWCFTMDPSQEWEYCEIPICPNNAEPLKAWKAPAGAKSEAAEKESPCEYPAPSAPGFTEHKVGRACMNNQGTTWWLITNKMVKAADVSGCALACKMMAGSEYFTFYSTEFTGDDPVKGGKNCGCYRECILEPEELTINGPTSYRMA